MRSSLGEVLLHMVQEQEQVLLQGCSCCSEGVAQLAAVAWVVEGNRLLHVLGCQELRELLLMKSQPQLGPVLYPCSCTWLLFCTCWTEAVSGATATGSSRYQDTSAHSSSERVLERTNVCERSY